MEGVEVMGAPLMATGPLGAGSFRDLPLPGKRWEGEGGVSGPLPVTVAAQIWVPGRVTFFPVPSLPESTPAQWGRHSRRGVSI